MLNVLIPLGGKSEFFDAHDFPFPKPLIEVCGKPMIQIVIEDMAKIAAKQAHAKSLADAKKDAAKASSPNKGTPAAAAATKSA